MTLNEREADTLPEVAHLLEQCKHRDLTLIERAFVRGARYALQEKAKAQAVPDNSIIVQRTREVVVAIEKMVEQQVEASGITSDVFRLDGWRILDAIQEASESGAEG